MIKKQLKNLLSGIGLAGGFLMISLTSSAHCYYWCHCTGHVSSEDASGICSIGAPIKETWALTPFGCNEYVWRTSGFTGTCADFYDSCCCWSDDPTKCWDGEGNACTPNGSTQGVTLKRHTPPSEPNPIETAKHPFVQGMEKEIRHSPPPPTE